MKQNSLHSRTVSIGGLTYDLFVDIDQSIGQGIDGRSALLLPLGSKLRVRAVQGTCGGGAGNTAVGLQRLGCASACLAVTGSDQWGEELYRNLLREGVDADSVITVEGEHSSFSIIIVTATGERVILNEPGTNAHLHDVTFDRERAGAADWIYLNRLHEESCEIEDDILAMLTSSRAAKLTWNPGGCQIEQGLRAAHNAALVAKTDLLLLNKEEALAFTGARTVQDALARCIEAGAGSVCVTDGRNGAEATDGTQSCRCPILSSPVIDTTGAGDAFGVGMTWALLTGKDLHEALRAGTINASSVVGVVGAEPGLLTETEMQSRLARTDLRVASSTF